MNFLFSKIKEKATNYPGLDIVDLTKRNIPYLNEVSLKVTELLDPLYAAGLSFGDFLGMEDNYFGVLYLAVISGIFFIFLYKLIPSKNYRVKHFFNFALGFTYCFFCYGLYTLNPIILCLIGFLLLKIFEKLNYPRLFNVLSIATTYAYLFLLQIDIFFNDKGCNHSVPAVIVMQYAALRVAHIPFLLNGSTKYHIEKTPTLLQYLGYCFHLPCFNTGPFLRFDFYLDFIHNVNVVPSFLGIDLYVLAHKFIGFAGFAAVPIIFRRLFNVPSYDIIYQDIPFTQVVINMFIGMIVCRAAIYSAFYSGEFLCCLFGYGYENITDKNIVNSSEHHQKNKNHDGEYFIYNNMWDNWRSITGSILSGIELGITPFDLMRSWNCSVQRGAKMMVFDQLQRFGFYIQFCSTMMFLCFLHGFYPGYMAMWLAGAIHHFVYVDLYNRVKDRKKRLREKGLEDDFFTKMTPVKWFFLWLVMRFYSTYCTATFVLVNWKDVIGFNKRFYFIPHIIILFVFVILKLISLVEFFVEVLKKKVD